MLPVSKKRGDNTENLARKYLEDAGLIFLQNNFSCKLGEIDLIMTDTDNTLVFVEVRFRNNSSFGGAALSVTPAKQRKLSRTAEYYLQRLSYTPSCRIDVIAVEGTGRINWIKNAIAGF